MAPLNPKDPYVSADDKLPLLWPPSLHYDPNLYDSFLVLNKTHEELFILNWHYIYVYSYKNKKRANKGHGNFPNLQLIRTFSVGDRHPLLGCMTWNENKKMLFIGFDLCQPKGSAKNPYPKRKSQLLLLWLLTGLEFYKVCLMLVDVVLLGMLVFVAMEMLCL